MATAEYDDPRFSPAWLKSRLTWGQKADHEAPLDPGYLYAWSSARHRREFNAYAPGSLPTGEIEGVRGEYNFLSLTSDGGAFRWDDKKFLGLVTEKSLRPGRAYCPYASA